MNTVSVGSAVSHAADEELVEVRNRLVAIASRRRLSMADIINTGIVFTREELALAARVQSQPTPGATAPSAIHAVVRGAAFEPNQSVCSASGEGAIAQPRDRRSPSLEASASTTQRYRPLPPGAQLRPDLPPDADSAWVEDEERRESISPAMRKEFVTAVKASAAPNPMGASIRDTSNNQQKPSSSWGVVNRAFGVEMETYLPKRSDEFLLDNSVKALRDVVPGLKTFLGADFPVGFHDYQSAKDDRAYNQWKITTDLSIKSEDGRPIFGLEFITPKLCGPHDLWKLEHFCDQLQAMSFNVNTSTALHVHVSTEDLSNVELLRLCQYCVVFEHVFDSFMTLPRRADYSRYCRSNLKSVSPARNVSEALEKLGRLNLDKSCAPLIRTFCPRLSAVRNSHRNHKINLLLLNRTRKGTPGRRVEFRQHQGSVDKFEIGAWVTLITKWVHTVSKLPPPSPSEGTVERFWQIVSDPKLRTYYTVKAQTLPTSMTFTYDSRELYAYDTDEEEKSDIDDGTPPQLPLSVPGPVPPPGRPAASPARPNPSGLLPPVDVQRQSAQLTSESGSGRIGAFGVADAFSSPSESRSGSAQLGHEGLTSIVPPGGVRSDTATLSGSKSTLGIASAAATAAPTSAPSVPTPPPTSAPQPFGMDTMFRKADGVTFLDVKTDANHSSGREAGEMSVASQMDTPMAMLRQQMRRQRGSITVGNFVLPLPLQLQALLLNEDGEGWDRVVSTEPEIVCTEREDGNDNNSWYVTAPTERLLRIPKRRLPPGKVRWVSPWVLEAKQLETVGVVQDIIRESFLVEEQFFASVSINVSSFTNSEICQVIAGVLIFERALCDCLGASFLESSATKDQKVFGRLIGELIRMGNVSNAFPKAVGDTVSKMVSSEILDLRDVVETVQPSRGNFSLRRALHFGGSTVSTNEITNRAVFLSYMCNHFAKRCKEENLIKLAEVMRKPQRRDLVDCISSLPSSTQRSMMQ